jgi:hypothetical protein
MFSQLPEISRAFKRGILRLSSLEAKLSSMDDDL